MITTSKYNFVKPELTDAADITAYNQNWDKLDTELGVKNIRSYTTLAQLGLSDEEMISNDFMSNIDEIVTTLDKHPSLMMFVLSPETHPNLHASVVAKLNEDTDITFSTSAHVGWMFIRFSGEAYRPVCIEVSLETEKYFDRIWTCVYNKGGSGNKVSKFITQQDDSFKSISTTTGRFSQWSTFGTMPNGKTLNDVFMIAITFNGAMTDAYLPVTLEGSSQFRHEETGYNTIQVGTVSGAYLFSGLVELQVGEVSDYFSGYLTGRVSVSRFNALNSDEHNLSGTIDKITVYFK